MTDVSRLSVEIGPKSPLQFEDEESFIKSSLDLEFSAFWVAARPE